MNKQNIFKEQADRAPNILFVCLDALRAATLRMYGGAVATPNMERLANEGAIYSDCSASGPKTWISLASLFTGLYPLHHGLLDDTCTLNQSIPTLAQVMQEAGYLTLSVPGAKVAEKLFGLDNGFHAVENTSYINDSGWAEPEKQINRARALADTSESRPYFVFMHYFNIHHMPPEVWSNFRGAVEPHIEQPESFSDFHERSQFYHAKVRAADEWLGRCLEAFSDADLIVLFSDHGEDLSLKYFPFPAHDQCTKDEIHVPLIIKGHPDLLGEFDHHVRLIDIFPTILSEVFSENPYRFNIEGFVQCLENCDGINLTHKTPFERTMLAYNGRSEYLTMRGDPEPSILSVSTRRNLRDKDGKVKETLEGLGYL